MKPSRVTVTGVAASAAIPVNTNVDQFNLGIGVKISATATYDVQYTYDDIWDPAVTPAWTTMTAMSAKAAAADVNWTQPVTAVRLNVSASTGTVTMTVVQAGI